MLTEFFQLCLADDSGARHQALRLLAENGAETDDYSPLALARLEQGNLSERIRKKLVRDEKTAPSRDRVQGLYAELAECLKGNEIW